MNSENIYEVFTQASNSYPEHIALAHQQKNLSYQELRELVEEKTQLLAQKGINKGDRVLVFVPISIELYAFLLALFKMGATAVFVDQWSKPKRLDACLQNVPCQGILGSWKHRILLSLFSREVRKIKLKIPTGQAPKSRSKVDTHPVQKEEVALITFTTGSTGIPKAAKRTHEFLLAQYRVLKEEMGTRPTDTDLIGLPIVILCNLGVGASTVIPNYNLGKLQDIPHEKLWKQIQTHKVNRIIHSPYFLKEFSHFVSQKGGEYRGIKTIMTGGAPVFPQDVRLLKKGFPAAQISIFYGSTEAEPISHISGEALLSQEEELEEKGLCVGEISSQIQLKIIPISQNPLSFENSEEFESFCLPKKSVGEIVVQGAHVLKEYINNPQAEREQKVPVGENVWHRTGDVGRIQGDKLFVLGRVKHAFFKEGKLLSPFIYEYLLSQEPDIVRATLLMQEKLTAFVQSKRSGENASLISDLRKAYPQIEKVIYLKEFPLDPRHHSKIDYDALKERYRNQMDTVS